MIKPVFINMMFPLWLFWLIPEAWIVIIPLTFITDSAVFLIALKIMKQSEIKQKYKKAILKIWLLGFAADIPGIIMLAAALFVPYSETGFGNWWYEYMTNAVTLNPYQNIFAFLYTLIAVAAPAALIYVLNKKIALKKLGLDEKTLKRLSLAMAVFTAPWLFLFPSGAFYM